MIYRLALQELGCESPVQQIAFIGPAVGLRQQVDPEVLNYQPQVVIRVIF